MSGATYLIVQVQPRHRTINMSPQYCRSPTYLRLLMVTLNYMHGNICYLMHLTNRLPPCQLALVHHKILIGFCGHKILIGFCANLTEYYDLERYVSVPTVKKCQVCHSERRAA